MPVQRVQVTGFWTDSLPRDNVANVLHFVTDAGWSAHQALCDSVNAAFKGLAPYSTRGITTKVYDLADNKPRPIKAQKTVAGSTTVSATGNRDTALCLSYYATRNLPRTRGRLYIGPFSASDVGANRPPQALIDAIATLPPLFAAAGGAGCTWCVYSPTMRNTGSSYDAAAGPVTNWYIDNEWDTQRRRGQKSTARTSGITAG